MGHIAAALGQGSTFEYQGKTYTVSPWTYAIQAQYERYIEERAIAVVKRQQRFLDDADYKDLLVRTTRDIAAGVYSFGSEAVAESLRSMPNLEYLFYLMLRPNHPEVTRELVREMVQAQVDEVMERISAANADPSKPEETTI